MPDAPLSFPSSNKELLSIQRAKNSLDRSRRMSDYVVLNAGGLKAMEEVNKLGFLSEEGSSSGDPKQKQKFSFSDNKEQDAEKKACRICHEDDFVKNLEAPCACNGSLKMAHRACIQKWCNEKRSIICEICKQPYQEGYKLSPSVHQTILDVDDSDDWDEMVFMRSRLFPTLEPHPLIGIDSTGDRVKAPIILAILLISMDLLMIWLAFSVLVEHIGSMLSTICLVLLAVFILIYTLSWVHDGLSGPRRRRLESESARASARLTAIPVGMPIPHSMHRRRVANTQSDSDEDKDSDTE